jgi:hypothetical protein
MGEPGHHGEVRSMDRLGLACTLYVVFANLKQGTWRAFGPYNSVELVGECVWACEAGDDGGAFQLAVKADPEGLWELHDGMDAGETFSQVLVLSPPEGTTCRELEQRLAG